MAWQVDNQCAAELIETLSDPTAYRWRDRVGAAARLAELNLGEGEREAATSAALLVLEDTYYWNPQRTASRLFSRVRDLFFLCCALGLIYGIGRLDPYHSRTAMYLVPGLMFGSCLGPFIVIDWIDRRRMERVREAVVQMLGRIGGAECLEAMAAAYFDNAGRVRRAAAGNLPLSLEALNAEGAVSVGAQTVPNLCRILPKSAEPLAILILDALELICDLRALPAVRQARVYSPFPNVCSVAQRVCKTLEERAERDRLNASLLRSAQVPSDPASTLMRPAANNRPSAPGTHLRPSGVEPERD